MKPITPRWHWIHFKMSEKVHTNTERETEAGTENKREKERMKDEKQMFKKGKSYTTTNQLFIVTPQIFGDEYFHSNRVICIWLKNQGF